jgi:hypothetical protein
MCKLQRNPRTQYKLVMKGKTMNTEKNINDEEIALQRNAWAEARREYESSEEYRAVAFEAAVSGV